MRWARWAIVSAWLGVHAALWPVLPPAPRWTIDLPSGFRLTADGRSLVTSNRDGIRVADVSSGRVLRHQAWPEGAADDLDIVVSPNGRHVLAYYRPTDGVCLIDLANGRLTSGRRFGGDPILSDRRYKFDWFVAFSPDGDKVVQLVGLSKDSFALVVAEIASRQERIISLREEPLSLTLSHDGRLAAIRRYLDPDTPRIGIEVIDLEAGRALWNRPDPFGDRFEPEFSPDDYWIGTGFAVREVEVFEARTGRRLMDLLTDRPAGFGEDGQLLVVREGVLSRADDPVLTGLQGEPIAGVQNVAHAMTFGLGRFVLIQRDHEPSAVAQRIRDWLTFIPFPWPSRWYEYEILDLRSGERRGMVSTRDERCIPSSDGKSLVTFSDHRRSLSVWSALPPRPGGLLLAVMIGEVGLAVVWTRWTRRARRPRKCAAA